MTDVRRATDVKGWPARPTPPGSDELLRLAVESATDFAIFAMDVTGNVTTWNKGAERLLGYTEDEMLGHSGDVVFTPEDRAAGAPEHERSVANTQGRAEDERWHLRKNSTRFWGSGVAMPLADASGFVKILRDRTERMRAQEQLREREELLRLLATNIPQLVFRTRVDGERNWGSPQWIAFTGLSFEQSLGFGWLEAVHPDDRPATIAGWAVAQETGEYYVEHRIRRSADAQYRWHQTRAKPITDVPDQDDWVGTSTDIHDIRGFQERQKILLAELQHRTRNLLAVVHAIARQTIRSSVSLAEFATEFEGRLRALSRVQGLLARVDDGSVDLRELVELELHAHGDGGGEPGKITIDGPPITLPDASTQSLALAIHELATNAVKYGALKQPTGKLNVRWWVEGSDESKRLVLEWRESDVEMPDLGGHPMRTGYGRELIERALPYQLKAETHLRFGPDGVFCRIVMAVERGKPADD
jgi:PAS domain S-box-containing protein